jgi:glycosyltransferase involved in cell wall biosynthesis
LSPARRRLVLAFPGDLSTRTGGYLYDRRVAAELERRGWSVERLSLPAGFPFPSAADLDAAGARLAAIPDGTTALVDGLALGAMPALAAAVAARLDLVALVHHPLCLEAGLTAEQSSRLRASEREALAMARAVIVTSPATADSLVALMAVPRARITVALPGTDPAALARGSPDGTIRMLCVGTVTPRKGHAILVQALAGVRGPWELTLAGSTERDPATVSALRSAVLAAGLGDRVTLARELGEDALAAAYDAADLFVSASLYEGYGMAIAEALARGLPVVAAAGGAVADTVPADAGLLVPPGDAAALRAALQRFLDEPDLARRLRRGAAAARERLPRWRDTAARVERAILGCCPA